MKRSILFGVLAMFAVSAMSVQNVNAQEEETIKSQKETKLKESKQEPKKDASSFTDSQKKDKKEVKPNGAPIHKGKGKKGTMKTETGPIKNDAKAEKSGINQQAEDKNNQKSGQKNDAKYEQKKAFDEPQVKDVQKGGQKNDAKAEQKKAEGDPMMMDVQKSGQKNDAKAEQKKENAEPLMRNAQPQQKSDVMARPKVQKPDYKNDKIKGNGKKTNSKISSKSQEENAVRPKPKNKATTNTPTGKDVK